MKRIDFIAQILLPPVALSASLAYTAIYFQQNDLDCKILLLGEDQAKPMSSSVDEFYFAKFMTNEFIIDCLIQTTDIWICFSM